MAQVEIASSTGGDAQTAMAPDGSGVETAPGVTAETPPEGRTLEADLQTLSVSGAAAKSGGRGAGAGGEKAVVRLFVGDVAPHTTEASFQKHFEQWGMVERVVLKHAAGNGFSRMRSFGFISVLGAATAEVIVAHRPHIIDGHIVATPEYAKQSGRARGDGGKEAGFERAHGRGGRQAASAASMRGFDGATTGSLATHSKKIFVGGLARHTDENGLRVRARPGLPARTPARARPRTRPFTPVHARSRPFTPAPACAGRAPRS